MYWHIKKISAVVAMIFLITVLPVFAAEDKNKIGDNIYWNIENGVLYVSGSGEIPNYTDGDKNENPPPWYSQKESIKGIVIESGITRVGDWAFGRFGNVCELSLPPTLETIGTQSFFRIGDVPRVVLPDGLTKAGQSAFGYSKIKSVVLPPNDANLYIVFANCSELIKAEIPDGVTKISMGIFLNCKNLKTVKTGSTLVEIGQESFSGCTSLENISLSESVCAIGKKAFKNTGNIGMLSIPQGVSAIPEGCFENSGIGNIYFENDNINIDSAAFGESKPKITASPDGAAKTFADANGLEFAEAINFGDKMIYAIGDGSDKSIVIGGWGAIPNYTDVGAENESLPPWYSQKDDIKSVVIGEGITAVGDKAFKNHTGVCELTLSSTLEKIGEQAFVRIGAVPCVKIPDEVQEVGQRAFRFSKIKSVVLPPNDVNLYIAFVDCGELTRVEIPDGVKKLSVGAFLNCSNLREAKFGSTLAAIGQESFSGCAALEKIYLSDSVTNIGKNAFSGAENLRIFASETSVAHTYAETNGIAYTKAENLNFLSVRGGEIVAENAEVKHNSVIADDGAELKAYLGESDTGNKIISKEYAEINILPKAVSADEGKNCYIEVTYKDNLGGCFWVVTTSPSGETNEYPPISCTATGEYKTAAFEIKNPKNSAYSVKLTSCKAVTEGNYSMNPVYIKDVVIYNDGTYVCDLDVTSENTGNIFYDSDAEFGISAALPSGKTPERARVKFNIYKYGDEKGGAKSDETLLHTEEKSVEGINDGFKIHIPVEKYGLYRLETEVYTETDSKIYYAKNKSEFSKCVRSAHQNPDFGVNTHFDSRGDYKLMIPLIANAGFGTVRQPIRWTQCEKTEGNISLTETQKGFLTELKKYNISPIAIFLDVSFVYVKKGAALVGDGIMDKYYNFVKTIASAPEMQDVKMFQIDNEPTQVQYIDDEYVSKNDTNALILKGRQYAKMMQTAHSALADANRADAEVGAFGLCMLQYKNRRDFMNAAFEYMQENGGADWFDALTVHPYYESNDPEHGVWGTEVENVENQMKNDSVAERCDYYRDIINGKEFTTPSDGEAHTYNFGEKQVWHTEFGWATSYGTGGTNIGEETEQAKRLIRQYAVVKANRFDDKLWSYSFMDNGLRYDDSEDNYGLVKSFKYSTPYAAKYGYLALANFNNLTADAISCEYNYNKDYDYITEFKFDQSDKRVFMLWSTNANGSVPQNGRVLSAVDNTLPNDVTFYDILGNEIPYDEVVVNNKISLSDAPIYAVLGGEKRTDMPKVYLTDGMIEIDSANRLKSLDAVTLREKNVTDDDDVYIAYYSDNRLVYIQKTDAAERQSLDVYKSGEYDSVTVIVWQKDSLKPVGYPLKI